MQKFEEAKKAAKLPLSICYRCSKEIIIEAQKYVPRIEYADWAKQGEVSDMKPDVFFKAARVGDMVLGRVTVDLVSSCLRFIRDGREAYVEGREIGKSIEYLIEKVSAGDNCSMVDFIKKLHAYHQEESERLSAAGAESRLINLDDRVETVQVIAEASANVEEMKKRINDILPSTRAPSGRPTRGSTSGRRPSPSTWAAETPTASRSRCCCRSSGTAPTRTSTWALPTRGSGPSSNRAAAARPRGISIPSQIRSSTQRAGCGARDDWPALAASSQRGASLVAGKLPFDG